MITKVALVTMKTLLQFMNEHLTINVTSNETVANDCAARWQQETQSTVIEPQGEKNPEK